jgi:hypothetical protein
LTLSIAAGATALIAVAGQIRKNALHLGEKPPRASGFKSLIEDFQRKLMKTAAETGSLENELA